MDLKHIENEDTADTVPKNVLLKEKLTIARM